LHSLFPPQKTVAFQDQGSPFPPAEIPSIPEMKPKYCLLYKGIFFPKVPVEGGHSFTFFASIGKIP
jgi:hypothetical protein